jgi:hypothetical protein
VNIEKVAQLAKLYATGALPDKELRAIKERANVAGNEIADKDDGAHLVPNDWGTASGLTRIRKLEAVHSTSASKWLGKRPTFLPGCGQSSLRSAYFLAHRALGPISL